MNEAEQRLREIAEQLNRGQRPESETVRTLLSWFDAQRRGHYVTQRVKRAMRKEGLITKPAFEFAFIDSPVEFQLAPTTQIIKPVGIPSEEQVSTPVVIEVDATGNVVTSAIEDPTYRIGRLPAANQSLFKVTPNSTLVEAVTKMLTNNVSQLPVMTSDRDVKGMISWSSIGSRLAMDNKADTVRHYMEPHYEVSSEVSIFSAIGFIANHDYVLVRDSERKISGIVTASDLSLEFHQLGEPFLLIGEIENHIRLMVANKFSAPELKSACDPSDSEREINDVSDLTFGEYVRLLEDPRHWERLALPLDRKTFIDRLKIIRDIRNDVMHFNPDPLDEELELKVLRESVLFLQKLREITAKTEV
jgi:predicted transcriptional regulator